MIQVIEREEDDKLVLYRGHNLFVLGTYEAEIWRMCNGENTINYIIQAVVDRHSVSKEKATVEITKFVNKLNDNKLISI
ncbi:MAG: PqqD family protein [Methanothrix sp.]|uniref:PqqD family protein n=1 Tax=Methanothrix sp. TaxID=90426 RepID=UPI0025F2CA9F|nr:PqqD family protein [Methanothrix sp.]MCK9405381.1 PqqD family protein [Methanothrix sp.]